MQLQYTLVSALLASVATAYPVSDEPQTSKRDVDASLFKRATPGSVNCGRMSSKLIGFLLDLRG